MDGVALLRTLNTQADFEPFLGPQTRRDVPKKCTMWSVIDILDALLQLFLTTLTSAQSTLGRAGMQIHLLNQGGIWCTSSATWGI